MSAVNYQFLQSINDIPAAQWNAVVPQGYPFIRHEFLAAMENSGCTTSHSGWQPDHLVMRDSTNSVIGVMPLYLKTDSMGEYVFDWSWADAYHQHGLQYYPKLLSAIPFTPAAGPRICMAENHCELPEDLVPVVKAHCEKVGASSWHLLFPEAGLSQELVGQDMLQRLGCQYKWFNKGYQTFDDFLATFSSRKRKNIRKERQRVVDAGIEFIQLQGRQIKQEHWRTFHDFYQSTYLIRGRRGYLNLDFFLQLSELMPDCLLLVLACKDDKYIAGALSFVGDDTLYGRYWGCSEAWEFLHFETCYYQGLDFAIAMGLQRFDSGAQGEHKIQRGFVPVATYSNHWIAHEGFRSAINQFLADEEKYIRAYMKNAGEYLPFRKNLELS